MPWYLPFPDSIKKRACRYMLQRYLGNFLEEKLTLDQLTVDLYNGKGTVTEVYLDVQALNSVGEKKNFPFEFVDGYIDKLSVTIPWHSLLADSSSVEVEGLVLTIQPKERVETGVSMFESMWSSMTSSMQMATEFMQQEQKEAADEGGPLEGLERFAQAIDSILTRVQVNFKKTLIRVEHLPKDCTIGVRLEVQIMNIDYCDEASINSVVSDQPDGEKTFQTAGFTASKFTCEGVSFYTDEFSAEHRIKSRSYIKSDVPDSEVEFVTAKSDINNRVLVSKLAGRQEIRLKLKQGTLLQGPKVEFELNLGSLTIFCSPRQLQIFSELASGFESAVSSSDNVLAQPRITHKPMDLYDYQRVEQQLMHQLYPDNAAQSGKGSKGLQYMQGWSAATAEDDEDSDEEEFQPAKGVRSGVSKSRSGVGGSRRLSESGSMFSDATSMEGSFVSNSSSTTFLSKSHSSEMYNASSLSTTPTRGKKKCSFDGDPNAEMSTFHIRVGSVALLLLHEDIMTSSPDTNLVAPGSVADMSMVAKNFFKSISAASMAGYSGRDFDAAKDMFAKACQLSHIRLLAAPVIIEGDEKTTNSSKLVSAVITAASVEVLECLFDRSPNTNEDSTVEYIELLKFMRASQRKEDPQPNGPISCQPDVWLHFKRVERIGKLAHNYIPQTDITVNLQQCWSEVDISIVDRISTVLNNRSVCQPLAKQLHPYLTQQNCFHQAVETMTDSRTDLKIKSPFIVIKLRIPIPDLRPAYDFDRMPWWKRSVRDDILIFHLFQSQWTTGWSRTTPEQEFTVQCKEVCAFFQEGNSSPIPFARTFSDEHSRNSSLLDGTQMYGIPRFTIKISPWQKPADLEDMEQDAEREDKATMVQSIVMETPEKEPSPFSSKRIVHESDTPHTVECEGEELIIPGDKEEMSEFVNVASQNTRIKVDIALPCLATHFPSKKLYELIYNRVNSDLLLWESSAPKQRGTQCDMNNPSGVSSLFPDAHFSMCKPGTQYNEDDEDADSSSEDNYSMHYSTWEEHKLKRQTPRTPNKGQSKFCLSLNVGHGRLNSFVIVKDSKGAEQGEMQMTFKDVNLFTVTGYQGRSHNNYICLQINYINFLHDGNVDQSFLVKRMSDNLNMTSPQSSHLHPTIYKTDEGAIVSSTAQPVGTGTGNSKDMFSLAVRTHYDARGDKIVRVACGIRGATLRHRVTAPKYNWFNQLLQFFEVVDYPVPGYSPPQVVTELHQHLWDCAVDYRPLNLPLRSLMTMGHLSISSNMIAHTNSSTLRFIAEDVCLFISDKLYNFVNLKSDYVCVLDLGLFELSLRLADNPRVDLRASNNIVHIRTCSDSARALGQLITYFACDGDLTDLPNASPHGAPATSSVDTSLSSLMETDTASQGLPNALSESTVERVNSLMEDAMQEVHGSNVTSSDGQRKEGVRVFFFPDEKGGGVVTSLVPPTDCDWAPASDIDSDNDFCILDHETGSGMIPQSGLPEIRILTNGPVQVVDNHFSLPTSKADHLQAPSNYPPPVLKYALREMTLVWHMYGGKDFQSESVQQKKQVKVVESEKSSPKLARQDSAVHGTTVAFSSTRPHQVNLNPNVCHHHQKPLTENCIPTKWQEQGGKGRKHDVLMELQLNKVRFLYEVYGKQSVQASRQVLTVQEVEIRDRLATSQINKFLYQYTSEARPKQSQANMVTVKAVHLRPDPKLNAQECCLKVTILPLRLNIDQDSLLFLITFSNEISGLAKDGIICGGETERALVAHCPTPMPAPAPVMSVETHDLFAQCQSTSQSADDKPFSASVSSSLSSSSPIFFRSFVFTPEVPIRLDYEGKRVDMTHGPLAGLLMGLAQLSCSELRLKRLEHKHGLLGLEKLLSYAFTEWFQDIKKNQLPNLIGGVGPIHSLIQLFQGIIDLFWLPIEQYQKDGRIVRGLQRGANSFTTSTAMAALEITTRLVQAIQSVAETAFDMVSPGPSVRNKKRGKKTRYNQPADIREGVSTAISLVREGLGETAQTLVRVASAEHETKGAVGAVGGVLRQLPPTVVTPIILASAATNNLLGGVRSQLVPDARREHSFKWRSEL